MTAGEIRRPGIGHISESANRSIHRPWAALEEAAGEVPREEVHHDGAAAGVAALLADGEALPDEARQAIENLLSRQRLLEGELARQRKLLQEWILSQLTYKTLYYQYSGQTPDSPRMDLMQEKEAVRRRIRDQLRAGGDALAVLNEQSRSPSRS